MEGNIDVEKMLTNQLQKLNAETMDTDNPDDLMKLTSASKNLIDALATYRFSKQRPTPKPDMPQRTPRNQRYR